MPEQALLQWATLTREGAYYLDDDEQGKENKKDILFIQDRLRKGEDSAYCGFGAWLDLGLLSETEQAPVQ